LERIRGKIRSSGKYIYGSAKNITKEGRGENQRLMGGVTLIVTLIMERKLSALITHDYRAGFFIDRARFSLRNYHLLKGFSAQGRLWVAW